jgi:uncharacterized membrane protein YdjX (TVP38/TMEM64 family)
VKKSVKIKSIIIYLVIPISASIMGFVFREQLKGISDLMSKGSIEQVVSIIRSWGIAAPLISIFLMIFQSIAAPIPAFLISAANGIIFGIIFGSFISWIGAMLGAVLSFFLARWFGETFVRKVMKKDMLWKKVDTISSNQGFKVVILARLIPIVSFDLISYAAGLSSIKTSTFLIATGIGMIPGTIAYTALGSEMSKIEAQASNVSMIVVLALILLGIILYIKKIIKAGSH